MRRSLFLIAAWVVVAVWFPTGTHAEAEPLAPVGGVGTPELPVPNALRSQVAFWKDVFASYSEHQVVLHDPDDLSRIYGVLDFRSLADSGADPVTLAKIKSDRVDAEKERISATLRRLDQVGPSPEGLSEDERRIWQLFQNDRDPRKFSKAADTSRIRAQSGIRERFRRGVALSRRYLPEIEKIFRSENVPVPVTRLALVESCFNVQAYSKAGAAGVWQFMPSTGRLFLRIDDAIDERRDPVLSARAAAQFLRRNYEHLGTWPLAITAYNHGPAGMRRATTTLGTTDIAEIIQHYDGPAFRFASRNFYPEFLAAVEVDAQYRDHFPDLELERPVPHDWVQLPHYIPLRMVARASGASVDRLLDLNPSFSAEVRTGKLYVPKGYRLRVPKGHAATFERGYASLAASQKLDGQRKTYVMHRVQRGQTLIRIARRYGTSVRAIQAANTMRGTMVRVGQSLKIPKG